MSNSAPPPPPPDESGPGGETPPPIPPPPNEAATPTAATPPPASASPSGPTAGLTGDHVATAFKGANPLDLGIIGLGVVIFLLSFFPYYTASVEVKGEGDLADLIGASAGDTSASVSAWHGFFGWFAALVALVVAVVLILGLLGILEIGLSRMIALGGAVLAAICIILALFVFPDGGSDLEGALDLGGGVSIESSTGHGFGYWLSLLLVLVLAAIAVMRRDAKD